MKDIITHPDLTPDANPRAASTRLKSKSLSQARGQRRHDHRIGKQPKYVDVACSHLNRVLISPRSIVEIRDEVVDLRTKGGAIRAMKSNAAIITAGVITFGHDAAEMFAALSLDAQDAAFLELADAVAARLGTRLETLVVHRDETTIHAHYELRGFSDAGKPLSKILTPSVSSELQDMTATIMQRFCPGIERGNKKVDRLAAGADYPDTLHRTVKRLHHDLPREIEALENRLSGLQEKADALAAAMVKDQERVAKLEAKERLNQKEEKRLRVYTGRLKKRIEEHLDAEQALKDAQKEFEDVQRMTKTQAAHAQESLAIAAEQKVDLDRREANLRREQVDLAVARELVVDDLRAIDTVVDLMVEENAETTPETTKMPDVPVLSRASSRTRKKLSGILETFWEMRDTMVEKEAFLDRLIGKVRRWLQRDDLSHDARDEGQDLGRERDEGPGW